MSTTRPRAGDGELKRHLGVTDAVLIEAVDDGRARRGVLTRARLRERTSTAANHWASA
jgi:hypothetical protein